MVDRKRKQRQGIDLGGLDTSYQPGRKGSIIKIQPGGGLGIAGVGLALGQIAGKGKFIWGIIGNKVTKITTQNQLNKVIRAGGNLLKSTRKPAAKSIEGKGVTTNLPKNLGDKQVLNQAIVRGRGPSDKKLQAEGISIGKTQAKEQINAFVKAGELSRGVGNSLKKLVTKIKNPQILNILTNRDFKRAAAVTGIGGAGALVASLASTKEEADAAQELLQSNFSSYLEMQRGGQEQARIAAEEAKGIFRTRRVLDDATKEKISRMRNLPPNIGAMIPIENKLNPYGESVVERGVYGPRNVFEEQRDVAARRARFLGLQPRVTEIRGPSVDTTEAFREKTPGRPRLPGIKPFRTPEGADVTEAFRDTVPADDTIAEGMIGQKLFGLRRTQREIDRDDLLTRNLAGETVTFKGKKYKPGQIDALVKATKIPGRSKTARTKDDPDRVKTVREDVARVLRPKKMTGGKIYASSMRKPKTLR